MKAIHILALSSLLSFDALNGLGQTNVMIGSGAPGRAFSAAAARSALQATTSNALQTVTAITLQRQALAAATMSQPAAPPAMRSMQRLDSIATCLEWPLGLAAWWQAEWNALDSVGVNHGTPVNEDRFGSGEVGQGFSMNGADDAVIVADAAALNFGATQDFSIEAWIQPNYSQTYYDVMDIVDKRLSPSWSQDVGYELCVAGGQLAFRMSDSLQNASSVFGPAGADLREDGNFHHVAVTVVRNSTSGGMLYVDGQPVLQFNPMGEGDLSNPAQLRIGMSANDTFYGNFNGVIDEVSIYHTALSAADIEAIYNAGAAGKCPPEPPRILVQPRSQRVPVGTDASLNVAADGMPPLTYQWLFNGLNLSGANDPTLPLPGVTLSSSGTYSVVVGNVYGTTASDNAVLTVYNPICLPPPAGLVAWWAGEDNAFDSVGANNGTPENGISYDAGMVGHAFVLNGTTDALSVPDAAALNFGAGQNFSIEAWIRPDYSTTYYDVMEIVDKRDSPSWSQDVGYELCVAGGRLAFRMSDSLLNASSGFGPAGADLRDGGFHHVAATVVRNSTTGGTLYVDGQPVWTFNPTGEALDLSSGAPLNIGRSANATFFGNFKGAIDEVSLYNTALTAAQIQSLYEAGVAGKCPIPPTIVTPPGNQTVTVGNDATLQVSATGNSLTYQWRRNGQDISGATDSTLYLQSVEDGNAGTYTVCITGSSGSVTSGGAVLTVVPAASVPAPSGAVAWWRCEGMSDDYKTEDIVGSNPGQVIGIESTWHDPGKVGYAMPFGGYIDMRIPYKAPADGGLNSSSWEGFTIEGWIKRTDIPVPPWVANPEVIMEQYDASSGFRITVSISIAGPGSLDITYVDAGGTHQLSAPPGTVRPGTFEHVAFAYKDDHIGNISLKLYLNGKLVASRTGNDAHIAMALGANDFHFGKSPSDSISEGFGGNNGGWMDELTIYNRALEEAEILGIYNASSAGKIPPCTQAPSVCVSWWQGEGNGSDVYAGNPAVAAGGVSFTAGQTGQAFTFNGVASVRVPASTALNVGAGNGFTLEAWVKPDSVSTTQPVLEWNLGCLTGVAIWISGIGYPWANLRDTGLNDYQIPSSGQMTAGAFQHIALTYCKTPGNESVGNAYLYLNGTEVGKLESLSPPPTPLTLGDLYFGASPMDDENATGTQFAGQIDEVALYSQALSASEIRKLYSAAGGGKCGITPSITTQPVSQRAHVGNTVVFQVVAQGTSVMTYHWLFNNGGGDQELAGETGPTLTLSNLQSVRAGTYSVRVANAAGSTTSSEATLAVNPVYSGNSPEITGQPQSTSACVDVGFQLTVGVGNHSGSLAYQWCKDGINIDGKTASSYTCSAPTCADSGTYSVVVYDSAGWVTSSDAAVIVHPRPTALVAGNATVSPGFGTPILAVLSGTGPWDLTWSDGGVTKHEHQVHDNPHARWVYPTANTEYTLTGLADSHCSALSQDLSGSATVTVGSASLEPPMRGARQLLTGTHVNFTFGADVTYYVDGRDGPVQLTGVTTIEGGTVVKFGSSSSAKIIIDVSDTTPSGIVCKTAPYSPAIFCHGDNDDYGYYGAEENWTSDPYGQGLSLAGNTATPVVLKNLRFLSLTSGVSFDGNATFKLYDCQFADCETALAQTVPTAAIGIYNALFCEDTNVFHWLGGSGNNPNITFQNVTADDCTRFAYGLPSPPTGTWIGKNSLLVATHEAGTVPTGLDTTCSVVASPATGVFVTGSDGSHYLPEQSSYRACGTTNIDLEMYHSLTNKTTHPPVTLPWFMKISGSLTFSPQAIRYVPGDLPDRGYYYDALDYTVTGMQVTGGSITVLPGTAIGLRYDWYCGFDLWEGSSFSSHGLPNRPVTFAPASAVQEGPFPYFSGRGFQISFMLDYWPYEDLNPAGNPPPTLDFRFSNLYLNSGNSHHFWGGMPNRFFSDLLPWGRLPVSSAVSLRMQDCHLLSGWLNLGEPNGFVIWPPADLGGQPIPGSVSLVNNLFERVNTSLDPDTGPNWWEGVHQTLATIDLSLAATNNTFRGGWLFLAPAPATAGDWVFENNLFDKVVLAQDQSQPLDYDYNAYWPCVRTWPDTDAELFPGQVGHLFPTTTRDTYTDGTYDGAHELALTAAPPYAEPGFLGNFYLPDTTPLHGAGSCSPAQVGLYHYTTRADQTKEGTSEKVNIGLHYVAVNPAGQPNPGLPKDSDGDGIPDYVENRHGDGATDWADETNWQADSSTLGHAYDPIYDDVDLSGNGLVGRIKKALNMQPLDAYNPLTLKQITTSQEPDVISFKVGHVVGGQFVPLAYDLLTSIGVLRFNLDGSDVTVQGCALATDGTSALLTWNTTYEPPGPHLLQPRLTLNGIGVDSAVLLGFGPLAPFYSDNVCRFFECDALFDQSGAYLDAQLPVPSATYSIQIFDPSTTPRRLLKTIPIKSTSNGMIQEDWVDLACDQGPSPFTGSAFDAVFDITLMAEDGSTPIAHDTPTKRHNKIPMFCEGNGFDVAYMYTPRDATLADSFSVGGPVWVGMQSVVDTLTQPSWVWPVNTDYYESSFDVFTYWDRTLGYPGYVTRLLDTYQSAARLVASLGDNTTKNFYCYAHGSPNTLENYGGSIKIPAASVASILGNSADTTSGILPGNPYRFVFLDGCKTAQDNQWRQAFGIQSLGPPGQAARPRLWPQAFVGYSADIPDLLGGYPGKGNINVSQSTALQSAYMATLQFFFSEWMSGKPLLTCVMNAEKPDPPNRPCPLPSWGVNEITVGPPYSSTPFKVNFADNEFKGKLWIYGHPGLTRSGLDPQADSRTYRDADTNRK